MDTITRSAMAVVQAEEGGLGVIDRGFRGGDIATQVREVEIVKRTQHGVISDPYTVAPGDSRADASRKMQKYGVGTLVVVDGARKLKGLLTARDVRFVGGQQQVVERMTPLDQLVVHTGPISLDEAERVMVERKVKKLPLVDENGVLTGLITAKDIVEQKRLPLATRDAQGDSASARRLGPRGITSSARPSSSRRAST
jgi:IMP dehydrogenase